MINVRFGLIISVIDIIYENGNSKLYYLTVKTMNYLATI